MNLPLKIFTPTFLLLLAFGTHQVYAQPANGSKQSRKEKIEAQRVAFITDKLDLTSAEAQVFWPVYNEFDKKRHEMSKTFHGPPDGTEKPMNDLSDKEATELADNQIIEAQKMLDLRKEYHAKFKSVLPPRKVLMLYDSEREFQKQLIDRLRNGKRPPEDKGKGPGRGQRRGPDNRQEMPE